MGSTNAFTFEKYNLVAAKYAAELRALDARGVSVAYHGDDEGPDGVVILSPDDGHESELMTDAELTMLLMGFRLAGRRIREAVHPGEGGGT